MNHVRERERISTVFSAATMVEMKLRLQLGEKIREIQQEALNFARMKENMCINNSDNSVKLGLILTRIGKTIEERISIIRGKTIEERRVKK
jgi:regulator of sigma D